jgi:hypothetical protein
VAGAWALASLGLTPALAAPILGFGRGFGPVMLRALQVAVPAGQRGGGRSGAVRCQPERAR